MAYITRANVTRITFESDLQSLDLKGEIYKIPIYFFSKYEENALLAIQELLKDPEKYFTEIYVPYKPTDTYRYVYEERPPAYHKHVDCPRLNSDYQNFEIPNEIREKGAEYVHEFRQWFQSVKHLLEKPDIFVERLRIKWGVVSNPREVRGGNSGPTSLDNYTIEDLEGKIDSLIKEAGRFYYKSTKNETILKRFSKLTHLAYKPVPLEGNNTGYSDEEVKELLRIYDEQFKKPLKRDLIEYYRLKLNPTIWMEGHLLERIGFKPCEYCHDEAAYQSINEDEPSQ